MLKNFKFAIALLVLTVSPALAFGDLSPVELLNTGHADEAIRTLNQQLNTAGTALNYSLLSRAYYLVEDYDDAVRYGERAVQLEPSNSLYQLWLGRAYGQKASQSSMLTAFSLARKTVASFEKAVQLNPSDWRARRDLAEFYIEAPPIVGGGKDKARKLADQINGSDPVNAALIRAMIAERSKDAGSAEQQLRAAVSASGNSSGAFVELARFYKNQGRWSEFDGAIHQALVTSRKSAQDEFDAGELLVSANRNLPLAVDTLKKYLSERTDEYGPAFRAHYLIGNALQLQGKAAEAKNEYRAALQLASGYRPAKEALQKLGS